jgi:hypothetical protein
VGHQDLVAVILLVAVVLLVREEKLKKQGKTLLVHQNLETKIFIYAF